MILDDYDPATLKLRQTVKKGEVATIIDGNWSPLIRMGKAEIADSKHIKRAGNRLIITVANGDAEYRIISDCPVTREVTAQKVRSTRDAK